MAKVTSIIAVQPVLPEHRYQQDEITEAFLDVVGDWPAAERVRRLHVNSKVQTRHLALPIEDYAGLRDFGAANDAFIEQATLLGAQAVTGALAQAGLQPSDVDVIFSTTVTGLAVPSVEARIAEHIGLRPDVKRVPMFGLGCVAGAAGIARLHEYLRGAPTEVGVLLSVELCSLTMRRNDRTNANFVASSLFGDGATAVVAVGSDRRPPSGVEVIDSRSHLYPDSLRVMGWDVSADGLGIVLDPAVPSIVRRYLGEDVRGFLGGHGLDVADITHWVCHPGGPKVIVAIEETLELPPDALELTWRSLAAVGNLSSSSVLHVLRDTIDKYPPSGAAGLLMAMGPGFCAELVLLRWH